MRRIHSLCSFLWMFRHAALQVHEHVTRWPASSESGYEGWQVAIDPKTSGPRVEAGLRQLFLPDTPLFLEQLRHYLSHELAGHVARAVNGENSLLALLTEARII